MCECKIMYQEKLFNFRKYGKLDIVGQFTYFELALSSLAV